MPSFMKWEEDDYDRGDRKEAVADYRLSQTQRAVSEKHTYRG